MRALWLAVGAVVTVFALIGSTTALWAGFAKARPPTEHSRRSIPFKLSQLNVAAGRGGVSVIIVPGEAGELVLERSLRWSAGKPTVDEPWDGHTLRLDASCPATHQVRQPICEVTYTLFVPSETDVVAKSADGMIDVNRLYGDVRMTSESGDLGVSGTAGNVLIRSGSGNVRANQLTGGEADVETGSGDIDLSFDAAPRQVRAVVRTEGDVGVYVPEGERSSGPAYDVTSKATKSEISVQKDDTSPRKITVSTKRGFALVCCG
jgi:hypothetical protein